jgi:pimeloyl-ACP methyl ester carboxylesterase
MPVLVLGAENDMITPIACQREIVEAIDNASFLVIEDCGHASMYEKPKAFVTAITGFIMFGESEYTI